MTKLVLSSQGIFKAGPPLLLFLYFLFFFVEVWLLYNVLVSTVQKSGSIIYTYMSLFFFCLIHFHCSVEGASLKVGKLHRNLLN